MYTGWPSQLPFVIRYYISVYYYIGNSYKALEIRAFQPTAALICFFLPFDFFFFSLHSCISLIYPWVSFSHHILFLFLDFSDFWLLLRPQSTMVRIRCACRKQKRSYKRGERQKLYPLCKVNACVRKCEDRDKDRGIFLPLARGFNQFTRKSFVQNREAVFCASIVRVRIQGLISKSKIVILGCYVLKYTWKYFF